MTGAPTIVDGLPGCLAIRSGRSPSMETLMDQRELTAWWPKLELFAASEAGELFGSDDRALFVTGMLCCLNGQQELWSAIYWTFILRDGLPDEDEWEYLERLTAAARRAGA